MTSTLILENHPTKRVQAETQRRRGTSIRVHPFLLWNTRLHNRILWRPPFRYTESDSHRGPWRDTLSPFLVRLGNGGSDRMAWNSHHHRSAGPTACGNIWS